MCFNYIRLQLCNKTSNSTDCLSFGDELLWSVQWKNPWFAHCERWTKPEKVAGKYSIICLTCPLFYKDTFLYLCVVSNHVSFVHWKLRVREHPIHGPYVADLSTWVFLDLFDYQLIPLGYNLNVKFPLAPVDMLVGSGTWICLRELKVFLHCEKNPTSISCRNVVSSYADIQVIYYIFSVFVAWAQSCLS